MVWVSWNDVGVDGGGDGGRIGDGIGDEYDGDNRLWKPIYHSCIQSKEKFWMLSDASRTHEYDLLRIRRNKMDSLRNRLLSHAN